MRIDFAVVEEEVLQCCNSIVWSCVRFKIGLARSKDLFTLAVVEDGEATNSGIESRR